MFTFSYPTTQEKPTMSSINAAQIDVLQAVADGPKVTSNVTKGDVVSGVASNALKRQGLVSIKEMADGTRKVSKTAAGTKTLKEIAKRFEKK